MSTNKVVLSLGSILNEIMDSKNQEKEICDLLKQLEDKTKALEQEK